MSGYYEWQDTPSGKQPWYFTARDGAPILTAAGLWDEWKNRETGERLKSCTMIITEPNDFAAEIHDRMPVFLTEQQFAPWLSGEAGAGILMPASNDYLQRWPVSKRVNSSKADADDAMLIEPVRRHTLANNNQELSIGGALCLVAGHLHSIHLHARTAVRSIKWSS